MPEVKSNETWVCRGHLDASFAKSVEFKAGAMLRSYLEERNESDLSIPLRSGFVWDAAGSNLPSAGTADDFGLVGTHGSAAITMRSADKKAVGATSVYARFLIPVDSFFDLGETYLIKVTASMIGAVADTSTTIDVLAYMNDGEGGVGSDLCGTEAQDMNSLTPDTFSFAIDSSAFNWGDELDVLVKATITDAAGVNPVYAEVQKLAISRDILG